MLFTPDGTSDTIPGDGNPPDIRGMGSFGGTGFITSLMTPPISGPPSISTIPIDSWNVSKDATGGEIYIAANDGGVIKKLQFQTDGTGANLVTSVFGRTGDVVAQVTDYVTTNDSVNMGTSAGLLETGDTNRNVAIGSLAASSMTTGSSNVSIGYAANWQATIGWQNSSVGTGAGNGITTGGGNTFIGASAGATLATGNSNICIGAIDPSTSGGYADVPAADTSNYLNIGNVIFGDMITGPLNISAPVLIQPKATYLSTELVPGGQILTKQYIDVVSTNLDNYVLKTGDFGGQRSDRSAARFRWPPGPGHSSRNGDHFSASH
jgi:hypothetical protein